MIRNMRCPASSATMVTVPATPVFAIIRNMRCPASSAPMLTVPATVVSAMIRNPRFVGYALEVTADAR